ncbi:MAG: hypothetical protein HQK58_02975 [Deltaproteobacteria bacterium]|nr:hypothetical protein [Deltaproteobacteria bacterium]MBF0527322.1 hypothetical protein [Deltaproteobacteria bacterium]
MRMVSGWMVQLLITTMVILTATVAWAGPCVKVYQGSQFSGRSLELCQDVPNLFTWGKTGRIGSISLPAQVAVILYEQADYAGQSLALTRDLDDVGAKDAWCQNGVKSLRMIRPEAPVTCVIICEDRDYGGRIEELCRDTPDLAGLNFQNMLSSLRIPANKEAILYEHADYQGRSLLILEDAPALDAYGNWWNDRISSIKIRPKLNKPSQEKVVTVFEHALYKGSVLKLVRDLPDLSTYGFNGPDISVKIPPGWVAQIYADTYYGGRSITLSSDLPDLSRLNTWKEQVSSIRVHRQTGAGG